MSFVFLGNIDVKKVRKNHWCIWCPENIQVGEAAKGWKGIMDGHFQQSYMHPECHEAMEQCEVVNAHDYSSDETIPWDERCNIRGKTMLESEAIHNARRRESK